MHNVHRNATVGEAYTSFMTMTDSMIHEVDTTRWLLDEEITSVQVIPPKRTPMAFPHLQDPQFAVFTTESGILSTVEFFANCQYGYDVRCELVGSLGTASHGQPDPRVDDHRRHAGRDRAGRLARSASALAYTAELQAWITGLQHGESRRPQRLGGLRGHQGRRGRRRGGEDWRADDDRLHRQARDLPLDRHEVEAGPASATDEETR